MARERIIGNTRFTRLKDAQNAVKEVLYSVPIGAELTGDQFDFIMDVVACHPDAEGKIGPGIAAISVRVSPFNQRGFWITRVDGTVTDISYLKCVNGAPSQRQAVHAAFRVAVRPQINAFRTAYFSGELEPRCALTGERLTMGPEAHVDHEDPTFVELADKFIELHGSVDDIELVACQDGIGRRLNDPELETRWSGFHEQNASLRVVSKNANLTRKRKDT
ncbi:MAG: DCL family protein [Umezawaea sp.]